MHVADDKKFGLDDKAAAGSQGQMVSPAVGGSRLGERRDCSDETPKKAMNTLSRPAPKTGMTPAPVRPRLRPEGVRGVQEGFVHKEGARKRRKFVFGVQRIAPVQGGFVQSDVALQGRSCALLGPFGGGVQGSAPTEAGCTEPVPKRRRLHYKQPAPLFTAYV